MGVTKVHKNGKYVRRLKGKLPKFKISTKISDLFENGNLGKIGAHTYESCWKLLKAIDSFSAGS